MRNQPPPNPRPPHAALAPLGNHGGYSDVPRVHGKFVLNRAQTALRATVCYVLSGVTAEALLHVERLGGGGAGFTEKLRLKLRFRIIILICFTGASRRAGCEYVDRVAAAR